MSKRTLEELEADRFAFSLERFPEATVGSSLLKAEDEISEIRKAFRDGEGKEAIAKEYVDVIMCVLDSAARAGIYIGDIRDAYEKKLAFNKSCQWKMNPDKTYSRVKEGMNG